MPEIDGLRFPAMLLVFLHHVVAVHIHRAQPYGGELALPGDWARAATLSPFLNLASRAGFGVQMFFVISGFVLSLPFLRAAIGGRAPSWAASMRGGWCGWSRRT